MDVCIDEDQGFVSHLGFSIQMPCNLRELVDHLSKFSKDTVLLRLLRTTIAIPRPFMPLDDCEALKH